MAEQPEVADCLFCRIVAREIPGDEVFRDDDHVAFRDINPQAPTHVLVVPTRHHADVAQLSSADAEAAGRLLATAAAIAEQEGIAERGYRLVLNTGPEGGQSVDHVHVHVLGGRQMGWPPG